MSQVWALQFVIHFESLLILVDYNISIQHVPSKICSPHLHFKTNWKQVYYNWKNSTEKVCIYVQANNGNDASCISQGRQTTATFTSMFSYWTLLHYRHPQLNQKASSASLRVACTINPQRGTSTSFSRVTSGNAAPELESLAMEMVSF